MYSENAFGNEASVEERTHERDADDVAVVDETQELRASVEQDIQAKVDYSDERRVDGRLFGQTLQAEEEMQARERDIARTRERFDRRPDSDREARTRRVAELGSTERRTVFQRRAASVDPLQDPDRPDPRAELERHELAAVNQQAARLERELVNGPTRCALSRQLAEEVVSGKSVLSATIAVTEAVRAEPGVIQPIASVDPWEYEADIQGTVRTLFEPAAPSQLQVGYVRDDSDASVKVTIWRKSRPGTVLHEGDVVRILSGKPGQYNGQLTLAVTHDTMVTVIERGDGPAPIHHTCRAELWETASDHRGVQRHGACTQPSPSSEAVRRPEPARFEGAESWIFPAPACPDWWLERDDVRTVKADRQGEQEASIDD